MVTLSIIDDLKGFMLGEMELGEEVKLKEKLIIADLVSDKLLVAI